MSQGISDKIGYGTICLLLGFHLHVAPLTAQGSFTDRFSLSGYLSFTESVTDMDLPGEKAFWESLLHNRLNLFFYPSDNWTFSLQLRNRFIAGDMISRYGELYTSSFKKDMGLVDMTWNITEGDWYVLNSAIDRLWLNYTYKNLEIRAGRQRINWGQTYVWNPNDWFNNFSFFDVDYMERPGSDALKVKYYSGVLSSVEAVVKVDSAKKYTAAGLFKTNIRQYDLQFLAGWLTESDLALGMGWAGGIGQIGFRGELSYFHPTNHFADTSGLFFASVALDYAFANTLAFQVEALYSQLPKGYENKSFLEFYSRPLSVKDISFTEYNLFGQASYNFTPLLTGSMAVMYFPKLKGYFLGPSITLSVLNNLDLALFMQYFSGEFYNLFGIQERQNYLLGFGRLKFSF